MRCVFFFFFAGLLLLSAPTSSLAEQSAASTTSFSSHAVVKILEVFPTGTDGHLQKLQYAERKNSNFENEKYEMRRRGS